MGKSWAEFGIAELPGVDDEEIGKVEVLLGVALPATYLDLVKFNKEASPEIASFAYGEDGTTISEFFEFSSAQRPHTIAWYSRPGAIYGLPGRLVPIARDAGDFLICLNYQSIDPTVVIFDPRSNVLSQVADNFGSFVDLWHE